ncbi:MAG TPA: Spy/CpxP family protein refolding chaperone [Xanthomonadales bacterium]|nr:Spy/CpxP family protein refolding chaperone [Xanthomonadales bacterium]
MKFSPFLSIPLALLLVTGSALAGPGDGPRSRHGPDFDKRVERMAEELDLTDEQSAQLVEVFEASAIEREALREKMEEQFRPERCALHLTTVEQIREILTDEQEAEMEDRLERWANSADSHGKKGRKGGPMQDCDPAGSI